MPCCLTFIRVCIGFSVAFMCICICYLHGIVIMLTTYLIFEVFKLYWILDAINDFLTPDPSKISKKMEGIESLENEKETEQLIDVKDRINEDFEDDDYQSVDQPRQRTSLTSGRKEPSNYDDSSTSEDSERISTSSRKDHKKYEETDSSHSENEEIIEPVEEEYSDEVFEEEENEKEDSNQIDSKMNIVSQKSTKNRNVEIYISESEEEEEEEGESEEYSSEETDGEYEEIENMKIFVKSLYSKTIAIYVSPDNRLIKVKHKIQGLIKGKFALEDQRIFFENQELTKDNKRIRKYGIIEGSIIMLVHD